MIARCSGGWANETHEPVTIGDREPITDGRITDGICDFCLRALRAEIPCKLCDRPSTIGLCDRCEMILQTHVGEPQYQLTVYTQSRQFSAVADGAGAHLRVLFVLREPTFRAYSLARIVEAVR